MVREERSRKKGIVSAARITAFNAGERQPLASQRANGHAMRSSITVMVKAMRKVLTVTSQRPDSNRVVHVAKPGSQTTRYPLE